MYLRLAQPARRPTLRHICT